MQYVSTCKWYGSTRSRNKNAIFTVAFRELPAKKGVKLVSRKVGLKIKERWIRNWKKLILVSILSVADESGSLKNKIKTIYEFWILMNISEWKWMIMNVKY